MWCETLEATTDVPPAALCAVAADAPNWPTWQPSVEVADGRSLVVREYGQRVRETIDATRSPSHLVVTAALVLARLRVTYDFDPTADGTRLRVTFALTGPLSWLYAVTRGGWLRCRLPILVMGLIWAARHTADWHRCESTASPIRPRVAWHAEL